MQHVVVALGSGIRGKGWAAHIRLADSVSNGLRLFPPVCFDHSVRLVPERLRDASQSKRLVLRLTVIQNGWRYVD